jgi:membrane associated rhomboid family serine protease
MAQMKDVERIRKDVEERQRGILVPNLIRSGRSVDEFMWKGDPKASLVQRIGLLIFGLMFLVLFAIAVFILATMTWEGALVGTVMGSISGIFSFRFLRNAFKKKPR